VLRSYPPTGPRRGRTRARRLAPLALIGLVAILLGAGGTARAGAPYGSVAPGAQALSVAALGLPGAGYAPLLVDFVASVSGSNGSAVTVTWTFGDGGSSSGLSVQHQYGSAGNYAVLVQAVDVAGDRGNASLWIQVRAGPSSSPFPPILSSAVLLAAGGGLGVGGALLALRFRGRGGGGGASRSPPAVTENAPSPVGPTPPEALESEPSPRAPVPADPAGAESPPVPTLRPESDAEVRRRTSEEILLHLGRMGHPHPDEVSDARRTQGGIGEHLGRPQNVVSPILRRLVAAGVVAVEVRHVKGGAHRMKVYRLTDRGEALVRNLRRRSP